MSLASPSTNSPFSHKKSAMSCAVGNDAARDAPKHSAAFILRAAIAAIVPAAGLSARCPSRSPALARCALRTLWATKWRCERPWGASQGCETSRGGGQGDRGAGRGIMWHASCWRCAPCTQATCRVCTLINAGRRLPSATTATTAGERRTRSSRLPTRSAPTTPPLRRCVCVCARACMRRRACLLVPACSHGAQCCGK